MTTPRSMLIACSLALASPAAAQRPGAAPSPPPAQGRTQLPARHEHAAPAPARTPAPGAGGIGIPESLRVEHEEIHAALVRATRLQGSVGAAARELAAVLHPHFVREEEIALPPLGLLAPLSRGRYDPSMQSVLQMTDALRAELPKMLREHEQIAAATRRLRDAARSARNGAVEKLANALLMHARGEEEVYYPAALLVGDVVRQRSAAAPPKP